MLRCESPAGHYRVTLMALHHPEPYHVQIGGHHDVVVVGDGRKVVEEAPWVGNEHPFEGELCEHELQFLNGVPGKTYRPEWQFTIESLDAESTLPSNNR